jgi:hypothetical protein
MGVPAVVTKYLAAAIGARSKAIDAGRALIDFLRTSGAVRVIRTKGMEPIIG